nr:PAS domain-containing protein [Spirochaetales bacterium]
MGNITKGKKQLPLVSDVKNLKEILETVPTGVALINNNQHLIYANSVALEMFEGYPETEDPIRFGDFVRCINRNKDPRGCGYSDTCSGCSFFRAVRERLSSVDSSCVEEGEAYIAREHPLRPLWARYKAKTLKLEMETYAL